MILPITDKTRILGDECAWHIQKRGKDNKETGLPTWGSFRHYPTLNGAVNSLSEKMLRESKAETLTEALEEVKRVHRVLVEALSPKYNVIKIFEKVDKAK